MFPKFIHLQSHFIHLYFLTEFEIIFYIFYVMPYEKSVFNRIVKDMVKDVKNLVDDTFSIALPQNSNCDLYQTELDNANAKLWNYCVIYLGAINAVLVVVFIYDVWKNYRVYVGGTPTTTPKHTSKSNLVAFGSNHNFIEVPRTVGSFEVPRTVGSFGTLEVPRTVGSFEVPRTLELSNKKNDDIVGLKINSIEEDIPISFRLYYWRNSGFVAEFIKTSEFIVLVALFEYFFFVSIVDHFKIANSHTLLCDGMNAL